MRALQGPLTIHLPKNRVWDDDTILALSAENPELRFEQTAQGDLIIMPPQEQKQATETLKSICS